jgi:hypothetical protein
MSGTSMSSDNSDDHINKKPRLNKSTSFFSGLDSIGNHEKGSIKKTINTCTQTNSVQALHLGDSVNYFNLLHLPDCPLNNKDNKDGWNGNVVRYGYWIVEKEKTEK